jgi:hypothetical protein
MAGFGVGAVLFIWVVGALLGGSDTPDVRGTANVRHEGVPLATSAPASNPPSSGRFLLPGPSGSASTTPSTTPPTTTTTMPTTTTPPAPTNCPDSAMRVSVTSTRSIYQVGEHPMLTLRIGNGGAVACVRDVSHQLRSVEIRSADGKQVLWSSADCYSLHTDEVHVLQPRQVLSYNVVWAGRTAAPGCPEQRTTVPAGGYEMIGRFGKLTGRPSPLILLN